MTRMEQERGFLAEVKFSKKVAQLIVAEAPRTAEGSISLYWEGVRRRCELWVARAEAWANRDGGDDVSKTPY